MKTLLRNRLILCFLFFAAFIPLIGSDLIPMKRVEANYVIDDLSQVTLSALPVINVWYEQSLQFGQIGNPQKQINILGNTYDPDGSVRSLSYQLNSGSSISIPIGPNSTRLAEPGDFNIAIYTSSLRDRANTVTITATDNSGDQRVKTITFNYTRGRTWPIPYSTNWLGGGSIHSQAQVVDGLWQITSSGVRPVEVGYDRLIAIGNISWTNYEILVPITVHAFVPDPDNPTDSGGVGIISRWQGHFGDDPLPDGWSQLGAYAYYSDRRDALALRLNAASPFVENFNFQVNTPYLFKLKSETIGLVGRYSFKIWKKDTAEPSWSDDRFQNIVNKLDTDNDLLQGSTLLVAHRTDATFGDATICPQGVNYSLNLSTSGDGNITSSPEKTSYQCGEGISLTARPQDGWTFVRWNGDINSSGNPLHLNLTKTMSIQAVFSPSQTQPLDFQIFLPALIN